MARTYGTGERLAVYSGGTMEEYRSLYSWTRFGEHDPVPAQYTQY
jgi:hypothetical protein